MKLGGFFTNGQKGKKKQDADKIILELDMKLRELQETYDSLLRFELGCARADKKKGLADRSNYARIGIAYYSLCTIMRGQKNLRNISKDLELKEAIRDTGSALQKMNFLSGRVNGLDSKKVKDNLKSLDQKASESGTELVKTLAALSELETSFQNEDIQMDALADRDVIDALIDGKSLEECMAESQKPADEEIDEWLRLFPENNMTARTRDENVLYDQILEFLK
ncbi:MAG: hypothetical protein LUF27_11800 [Lachnospiraceae bacterium]|nr:hypothetical protein [Lachnospiraceae bacterium]